MPFPPGPSPFPGKDEVADYQAACAAAMDVPVVLGSRVIGLRASSAGYVAETSRGPLRTSTVVVATGMFDSPRIPPIAAGLSEAVAQIHSSEYRRPAQLPDGPVVIVGAANSGAEIAVEVARHRPTVLSASRIFPLAPRRFRQAGWWRIAQLRTLLLRGRRPPAFLPWPIRVGGLTKVDLQAAARDHGLRIVPRAVATDGDTLRFSDGGEVRARTVIWATGFRADRSWVDPEQRDATTTGGPHGRTTIPGLWLVGGQFLFAITPRARDTARDVAAHLRARH